MPCTLLTAIGVGPDGKRSILGCSAQLSEAETHWRSFLQSVVDRGMRCIKLVVSDDYSGHNAARQPVLAGLPWQRSQFHPMQNAMAHVPKIAMQPEDASDLRRVFDAHEPAEAQRRLRAEAARDQKAAPQLAASVEENVPEAVTVLRIPATHRRRLRRSNALERLNKELKRRTRLATLIRNEACLLRLASAVLSEIKNDWEIDRAYLNMEARWPATENRKLQNRRCFIRTRLGRRANCYAV